MSVQIYIINQDKKRLLFIYAINKILTLSAEIENRLSFYEKITDCKPITYHSFSNTSAKPGRKKYFWCKA
ncbi:hypothetical protein GCM10027429_15040 [Marivirga atlantica]